jgi:hypothetical protein
MMVEVIATNLSTWTGQTTREGHLDIAKDVLKGMSLSTFKTTSQILTPMTKKAVLVANRKNLLSTYQGMNEKNRWHFLPSEILKNSLPSGIQKIPSFTVPPTNPFERRGERSKASPLKQIPNTHGILVPLTLRPVRELDLDQLDLGIPGADENPLVVQPYFAPGSLNPLYRHRRCQSSIDGSASAYQRRERRRRIRRMKNNQMKMEEARLDLYDSLSDASSEGDDFSCYYDRGEIFRWLNGWEEGMNIQGLQEVALLRNYWRSLK